MREWWRDAVIYQVYPRSFQDSNGDGIGDLAGITARLPHIAALGVDAIWLSPFFTSPDKDMGYDVSDYTDVNPLFGTLADFDAMVARAHELGLRVIIDQVISHTSDQHPWFKESRQNRSNAKADWYVWADPLPDGSPPNNWLSVFGGSAWMFEARRRQYYLHNFLTEQPDLNFRNPEVVDTLLGTMDFWLARGVDGFRLDTVNYYTHDDQLRNNPPGQWAEFPVNPYEAQEHVYDKSRPENLAILRRIRALTDRYDDRMLVGEVGAEGARQVELMAEYTSGADLLHMAYSFTMLDRNRSAAHFRLNIEGFFAKAPKGWPCWSFSNHDVQRHASRWTPEGGDVDAVARQAIALLCSFPGAVGIYQGEELGQTETDIEFHELRDLGYIDFWPDHRGRDGCRTPMVWEADAAHGSFTTGTPWLPVKPPQQARAVDSQNDQPDSVLGTYRAVLGIRRDDARLHGRDFRFLDLPEPLLALERGKGPEVLSCVFNLGDQPVTLRVASDATLTGPHVARLEAGRLELPAYGFAYLNAAGRISLG